AVSSAPQREVGGGGMKATTILPQAPDTDPLLRLQQTDSRSQVMGSAGEIRNGNAGCKTVLEAFLPERPVKEF
ncbi:MAG: hypothetical protein ACREUE_08145, partial [Panacagrimonas sp.]